MQSQIQSCSKHSRELNIFDSFSEKKSQKNRFIFRKKEQTKIECEIKVLISF
ncbi:hypothetical protein LSS_06549 [Leptospira santarosai serovar Shermani str. LT 821]|uniref:Uncharacterized protein n=1 Tax=Leptospira santarosai serovar Shermani str. LT 821 TaxID=758847 RepID=K8Y1Y7_9LEPT|nr:hypothetical protein LSS_06549 [Leptospira santarosai serovar Shermani str. LT 821]